MNLDRKVIADISEGHGHDRRVEGARMEWIGSDGKGGGGVGGGAGQASQMWADITALYFTLPQQQWSGHDSATQFCTRTKLQCKSKILQHSAAVYFSTFVCCATFNCSVALRGERCIATLHCIGIWECIGTGRGVGRAE